MKCLKVLKLRTTVWGIAIKIVLVMVLGCGWMPKLALSASLFESCGTLLKEFIRDPDYLQGRAREALVKIRETQKESWLLSRAQRPEQAYGAQEAEALRWFRELSEKDLNALTRKTIYTNQAWGNSVELYGNGSFGALLKKNYRRSSFDGEKAHHVSNNIRYEVLAHALDRYLGTNLVPPARFLNGNSKALVLFIPFSRSMSWASLESNPKHLVRITHTRYLDELLSNRDRENSENMLLGPQGAAVAIDFDLSQANGYYSGFNSYIDFVMRARPPSAASAKLPPRKVALPGVTSKSVYEKLEALNSDSLNVLAGQAGITLTENEQKSILGGRSRILGSIDKWKQIYGEEQVILGGADDPQAVRGP